MTKRTSVHATSLEGDSAPPQLATVADYARLRGCSRQAVEKAAAAGRITLIDSPGGRKVDVDAANLSWAARSDTTQQQRGAAGQVEKSQTLARASAAKKAGRTGGPAAESASTPPPAKDIGLGLTLMEEKTRSERLRIQRQEMDLAERRGELVSRAAMRAAISVKLIESRELFESIPDRLAARLAAERDPNVVRRLLLDEINHAMTLLATVSTAGPH